MKIKDASAKDMYEYAKRMNKTNAVEYNGTLYRPGEMEALEALSPAPPQLPEEGSKK